MDTKFLKKLFLLTGIFLLSMTLLGHQAISDDDDDDDEKSSKQLIITEVYVDFENSKIYIHGNNFKRKRKTPQVFLAADPVGLEV
jgi:hypothetical protein